MEGPRRNTDPDVLRAATSPGSTAGDLFEQKRVLPVQFVSGDAWKIRRTADSRQDLRQVDATLGFCAQLGDDEESTTRPSPLQPNS
jgi:hypothetical protein